MEGEREKSPINAEQQAENIHSVSSDGQRTSGQPSSSVTSALSSKPQSPRKHMDSSERALSDNIGMQLCPDCNIELDPNVHRFCYGCAKTMQEIVLFNAREEDTNLPHSLVLECDISEQISNSGIDVANNIKEVKQPVIVGETERTVAGTQGFQQITSVTGQMPVNKTKTVEKTKSPVAPEKTIADDQNSIEKGHEGGETGSMDVDSTVHVPNKDVIPNNDPNLPRHDESVGGRSCNELSDINNGNDDYGGKLTNNSVPGTEEDKPSLQELNEVVGKFNEFVEEIHTAGTGNVHHEPRTPEHVQHSEEKKESEKGKSEKKGGNDKLKKENKGPRNNSGISDANGEGTKVDKLVGKNLKTTTAGNNQQIAKENSKNNKADESSGTRIAIRSTTDAKGKTSKPQGVVQGQVPKTKETLLKTSKAPTRPLSDGNGSTAIPLAEEYTQYRKAELEKESGRKDKKKGKTKHDKNSDDKTVKNDDNASKAAGKTLIVVFHAILSDQFEFDNDMKIVIRGEEPVFNGWDHDSVHFSAEKGIDKQFLVHGVFSIPPRLVSYKCAYKYVILSKKNEAMYEELVEYQTRWGGFVDRCLVIEGKYVTKKKIFHKYDGFIYPKPAGGVSWVFSSGPDINDRRASFRTFFPKWRGFYVNSFDTIIQPAEALHSLECLVEGTSASRTSTSGDIQRRTVDSQKLRLDEVVVYP